MHKIIKSYTYIKRSDILCSASGYIAIWLPGVDPYCVHFLQHNADYFVSRHNIANATSIELVYRKSIFDTRTTWSCLAESTLSDMKSECERISGQQVNLMVCSCFVFAESKGSFTWVGTELKQSTFWKLHMR